MAADSTHSVKLKKAKQDYVNPSVSQEQLSRCLLCVFQFCFFSQSQENQKRAAFRFSLNKRKLHYTYTLINFWYINLTQELLQRSLHNILVTSSPLPFLGQRVSVVKCIRLCERQTLSSPPAALARASPPLAFAFP